MKAGDKVQLVSGSNTMTIAWSDEKYANVVFWNPSTHDIIRQKIEVVALKAVS